MFRLAVLLVYIVVNGGAAQRDIVVQCELRCNQVQTAQTNASGLTGNSQASGDNGSIQMKRVR